MARTGTQLMDAFSIFIDDSWQSTATSDGTTATIVDTALQRFGTDGVRGAYARNTEPAHAALWEIRRISDLTTFTATVTPVFGTKLDTADAYEIHRWDPAAKFTALDEAAKRIGHHISQLVFDETLTSDGIATSYTIPSTLRTGPVVVQVESDPGGGSRTGHREQRSRGARDRRAGRHEYGHPGPAGRLAQG